MQTYLVGGAVRDTLLGLPVIDRDWVVVGATPQQLVAQGFTPVGKDFPVFLHPRTREQYALARTERKTAPGYRGFAIHAAPDVTLEQDLERRDLTINAVAVAADSLDAGGNFDPAQVALIDPHGGQRDLQQRTLRHVSDAFREDPVRMLRVARFAARFADFSVAPATMALMRSMVTEGEAAALVAERVWQELARGLMERTPARMLAVLRASGALQALLPELGASQAGADSDLVSGKSWPDSSSSDDSPDAHRARALDQCAATHAPLSVRFAGLCRHVPMGTDLKRKQTPVTRLCQRLRVPADCRELAELAVREAHSIDGSAALDADALVRLLERCDALRKPARFAELLWVCDCDARARLPTPGAPYAQRPHLLAVLAAAQAVATDPISRHATATGLTGLQIGALIHGARVAAVQAMIAHSHIGTAPTEPVSPGSAV